MSRLAWLLPMLLAACGGGQPAPVRPDAPPRTVLLLQIDGLSPALLEQYLRRPASRGPDRALAALMGVSPPGATRITYDRAVVTTAIAPLGADGVAAGATLLTGRPAVEHGAWQGQPALPAEIPSVFEQLGGRPGAVAGLPARGPALTVVDADTDAARVEGLLARLPSDPALVAVRFTGLAAASPADAPAALAAIDQLVARLRAPLSPATLVVITAGFGGEPGPDLQALPGDKISESLNVSGDLLRVGGGVLQVEGGGDAERVIKLIQLEAVETILVHDGTTVGILDRELGNFRPLLPGELPGWPDLAARVQAAARPGNFLAVARRGGDHDFGLGGGFRRGGPARAEAEVPLILAGPMLQGVPAGTLEGMTLLEVAPTVRGAVADGADGRWPALRRRLPPEAPVAPAFLQQLGASPDLPAGLHAAADQLAQGRYAEAVAALEGLKGLAGEAETWRGVLHGWAVRKRGTGDAEPPPWPVATGLPGRVLAIARLELGEEGAPPLPAGEGPLAQAFSVLYGAGGHPCSPPDQSRADQLAGAATSFADARLPGFAARAEAARSKVLLNPEAIRQTYRAALELAQAPHAGHARQGVLQDLLVTSLLRPDIAMAADAELNRAAELLLLHLQAEIAADTGPGAKERRVAALASLVDGVAVQRQPRLAQETVGLAVQGEGGLAASVVQALVGFGGLATLLRGDLVRGLVIMQRIMEDALAEVAAKPDDQLSADDRVARAVPLLIGAALKGLQGQLPEAQADLARAEALLPLDRTLADRQTALQAAGPEGEPTLAAWGPFVRAAVLAARSTADLVGDDPAAAVTRWTAVVELARQVVRAEFARSRIKGLDEHVDALAAVLSAALAWGAAEATGDGTAAAKAEALRREVARIPLDAPQADPAVRPWLTLVGVLLHDVAWAAGSQAPAELAAPTAALEKLLVGWRPDSRLGQTALFVVLALQHTLPDLEKFKEIDTFKDSLSKLPRLAEALTRVRTEVRGLFPEAELAAQLQADKVERVILENMLLLLEVPPASWLDPAALVQALVGRNDAMYAIVKDIPGDTRDVLTLTMAFLDDARGDRAGAAARAAAAVGRPAGPAFAGYGVLWHALEARFRAQLGDAKGADQAAARAQAACAPMAWRLAAARGVWLMQQRDPAAAHAQFRAAREGGRKAGHGEYGTRFNLAVQDGQSVVTAVVQVPLLGILLGKATGTFQIGAGGTSAVKQSRTVGWQLVPEGTTADAAFDALALEGWTALAAGDQATAGRAISQIMALMYGLDPRHLDDVPVEGLPPHVPSQVMPRSPELLAWFATLASLHGHDRLGDWLLVALAQRAQTEWKDSPGGIETVCDDATVEKGPGDQAGPIVTQLFCRAPAPLARLLGEEGAAAFAELVVVRLRARGGEKVDEKPVVARVKRHAPRLLGGGGRRPADLKAGAPDAAQVRALVKAGYACELGMLAVDRPELAPLVHRELPACGPAPFRAAIGLNLPIEGVDPESALLSLQGTLEVGHRLPMLRDMVYPAAWPRVFEILGRPDQRGRLLERVRHWTALADGYEAPEAALWVRALGVAASPGAAQVEHARALLRGAFERGLNPSPATRYLKLIALGQDPREAAVGFLP